MPNADPDTIPENDDRSKAPAQQWELRLSPRGLEIVAGDVQLAESYWWAKAGAGKTVESILAGEGFSHDPNSFGGGIQGAVKANAEQLANWRKMAAAPDLLEALTEIDGEAPVKEPRAEPTVGPSPGWRTEMADEVYELVREAFEEGKVRGRWEAAQTARSAISRATGGA